MTVEALYERFCAAAPTNLLREASSLRRVAMRWLERHRSWHGPQHVVRMLDDIERDCVGSDREALVLAAIYHDAVYDPRSGDNEERSASLLLEDTSDPTDATVVDAVRLIQQSKWTQLPTDELGLRFFELDSWQLAKECPLHERMAYERGIFREYQWAGWGTYREKRREFLQGWAGRFPQHREGVAECIELLCALQPQIGIYPGSFNPFHRGHLSILRQAEAIFDQVIVAVGVNRQKRGSVETATTRHAELGDRLRFHQVVSFDGLLTTFIDELDVPSTLVRGVRDGTDLEAELRFSRFLNELRPDTRLIWISCESNLQHLSSSAIRELESIEAGAGQRYIPTTSEVYGTPAG